MISLNSSTEELSKIGAAYQKRLKRLGIKTVRDLLYYFPVRYNDFSEIIDINQVKNGVTACVQGHIIEISSERTFRKWMDITEAIIEDKTGQMRALWFNQPYITTSLKEGDFVCLAGKISLGKGGLYLNNPIYEKTNELEEASNLTHTGRIVPVYSETKGITSRWLRYIIKPLLVQLYKEVAEVLPENLLKKHKFLPIQKAIWQAHFPDSFEAADAAKARFSFEELLLLQLSVLREKDKLQRRKAPACLMDAALMKKFTANLPFELTNSQRQCAFQILKDLEKPVPMSRLLEGDVGSGKTVVAAMAALNTVKCGYQVAFMAPTEILASQHFRGISKMLNNFGITVGYLTSKESFLYKNGKTVEVKKKDLLLELEFGQVDILIGTHSLISKGVVFSKLGLVVLDEQHRFGVSQRAALTKTKGLVPHLLSMTATPIPRTLALTVYGDLDLSLIKEMPKNRKKIKTLIINPSQRKQAYEFIKSEVKKGRGVFVICPKIEKSQITNDKLQINSNFQIPKLFNEVKAVTEEYERLSKEIFPDLRITMLHGKMKAKEKEKVMADFKNGEVDILVSTSVVEVGVDVPRATVMMIEGAERFGLAQLHQFRGRVGRSDMQSYCFLFTTEENQQNRKRLKAMETMHSGFDLAQEDLKIRGPGQLYGTTQWGLPDMAMQALSNIFLVEKTRTAAKELLEADPELKNNPLLLERVKNFKQRIHFE